MFVKNVAPNTPNPNPAFQITNKCLVNNAYHSAEYLAPRIQTMPCWKTKPFRRLFCNIPLSLIAQDLSAMLANAVATHLASWVNYSCFAWFDQRFRWFIIVLIKVFSKWNNWSFLWTCILRAQQTQQPLFRKHKSVRGKHIPAFPCALLDDESWRGRVHRSPRPIRTHTYMQRRGEFLGQFCAPCTTFPNCFRSYSFDAFLQVLVEFVDLSSCAKSWRLQ